jgi:hypothetical protein
MRPLSNVGERELYWIHPKLLERRFELRAEDDLFATLEFETALGSLATAKAAAGNWTFKRVGFFRPQVTVRVQSAEDNLAIYRPKWAGAEGVLEFADGETFVWKLANFWATRYEIADTEGNSLVSYKSKVDKPSDLLKDQAQVEMSPQAREMGKLALLLLIGWYLIILQQEDVRATATAVAARAVMK